MANYGTAFASFYNSSLQLLYDDGTDTPSTSSGTSSINVLSARGNSSLMGVGYGEFYIPPNDNTWPLVQVGFYAVVYQHDQVASSYQGEIACFIIKDVHVEVLDNVPMLKISGPEVSHELTQWLRWQSIGSAASDACDIKGTGTLYRGTNIIDIADADISKFAVGSGLNFVSDASWQSVHKARVTAVDSTIGAANITIDPPLYSEIADVTTIRISITDYQTPATDDVTQIMSGPVAAGSWAVSFETGTGTAGGTSHVCGGVTVLDLLNRTSDISSPREFWRLKQRSAGNVAPLLEIEWRRTSDSTGIELVMPTQAQMISRVTSASYGIISSVKRAYRDERVSHVIAYGGGSGDKRVTLRDATNAAPAGYTLTNNTTELYTVLSNNALVTAFSPNKREVTLSFPGIVPGGVQDADIQQAGNQLLAATHNWMEERNEKIRHYEVDCTIHKNIRPGQTINLTYSDNHITLTKSTLYILEYEHYVGEDNVRRTKLILSEELSVRKTGNDLIAASLKNNEITASTLGISAASATPQLELTFDEEFNITAGYNEFSGIRFFPFPGHGTAKIGHLDLRTSTSENDLSLNIDEGEQDKNADLLIRSYIDTDYTTGKNANLKVMAQAQSGGFPSLSEESHILLNVTDGLTSTMQLYATNTTVTRYLTVGSIYGGGGIVVDQGSDDSEALALQSSDVAHGMTTITATDTYGTLEKWSGDNGGLAVRGLSDTHPGLVLLGYSVSTDNTETTSSVAPVMLQGSVKTGTSATTLADDENIAVFRNYTTAVSWLKGDGTLHTHGTVLNQGADDDAIIKLQSSDIAHGITTVTDTDTYGLMAKYAGDTGGLLMRGLTEATVGMALVSYPTTVATTEGTSAVGAFVLHGRLKSGTGTTAMAADDNLVVFQNEGTTNAIIKADGTIYNRGDLLVLNGITVGSHALATDEGAIVFEIGAAHAATPASGGISLYAYNGQLWAKNATGTTDQITAF